MASCLLLLCIVTLSNNIKLAAAQLDGLPLAPVELEVVTGDSPHQLQLSWIPPFSLPGETIFYSLLIQDLATGLKRTVEPLSLTVFTYQLSEMEALACHSFIFSVFSLNEVGLSINSSSTVSPSLCILDSTTITPTRTVSSTQPAVTTTRIVTTTRPAVTSTRTVTSTRPPVTITATSTITVTSTPPPVTSYITVISTRPAVTTTSTVTSTIRSTFTTTRVTSTPCPTVFPPPITPVATSTPTLPPCAASDRTKPNNIVNVVKVRCGHIEWDPATVDGCSDDISYRIRIFSGNSFKETPPSQRVVLSSHTNSLTFSSSQVPSTRPLRAVVTAKRGHGVLSQNWSGPIIITESIDC